MTVDGPCRPHFRPLGSASSAARIVGNHNMSRPAASCSFKGRPPPWLRTAFSAASPCHAAECRFSLMKCAVFGAHHDVSEAHLHR
jgi:hypothetical protein